MAQVVADAASVQKSTDLIQSAQGELDSREKVITEREVLATARGEELARELERFEEQMSALHMKETAIATRQSDLQVERESWLAEQTRSTDQIDEVKARLTLLQVTITEQQDELGQSVAEAEKRVRDLTEQETSLAQREKEFVERSIDMQNFNASLEDKEREIKASRLALEQSRRELDNAHVEVQQKRESLVVLEQSLVSRDTEIAVLRAQVEEQQSSLEESRSQFARTYSYFHELLDDK